ncbi:histidine phosphatase family protein [Paenibacillus sp. TRM 82003]|nr:histidine phosphatase family protein [Paenibacillus sp. TRM 82003]
MRGALDVELIFVRHGQGIHNTNIPDRLNVLHPRLTERGKLQVARLHEHFGFTDTDVFLVSPTVRTIETANLLTRGLPNARKYVDPAAGPRMFPLPENPTAYASRCDIVYPLETIRRGHPEYILRRADDLDLWTSGINTMDQEEFLALGHAFIGWVKSLNAERVFMISHDGTITNYRILLGEVGLTRADFLGEAGWKTVRL